MRPALVVKPIPVTDDSIGMLQGLKPLTMDALNRPGNRGGWLVLIMRLLSIPADYARIVPQTLRVGCDRWVQGDVLG